MSDADPIHEHPPQDLESVRIAAMRTAARMGFDNWDAEDIGQEASLRAIRQQSLDEPARFGVVAGRSASIDEIRRRSARPTTVPIGDEPTPEAAEVASTETLVLRRLILQECWSIAEAHLTPRRLAAYRETMAAGDIGDAVRSICDETGVTESTVRLQVKEAFSRIRLEYGGDR